MRKSVPALAAITLIAALTACTQPTTAPPQPAAAPTPVTVDAPSGEYHLDKNHSSLLIRASHFGLSHYTVRLTKIDATLNFDQANPTASTLTATADAHSVRTEYPGARNFDAELSNSQWLDADSHPEISFRSAGIELTSPNTGRMNGDLTIRGVTKPATLDVTFNHSYATFPTGQPGAYLGFSAHGTFKRSDYGMMVMQPPAGAPGSGVSDEVEIIIEAEFTNRPSPPTAVN